MFFLMLLISFGVIGSILCMIDTFLPGFFIPIVAVMVRWVGVILIWCGVMVYVGRQVGTRGSLFGELANPARTICIHLGKSNGKFLNSRKTEPNRLKAKGVGRKGNMNIKDMGEAINIAGHDVVITTQDDGHNYPLWVIDAVDKWKKRWKVANEKEFINLYNRLKNIKSYAELDQIPFLKPIMENPEHRRKILDLSLEEIREMKELIFDGRTINAKAVLGWSEGATPYDNEGLIESEVAHHRAQDASLRFAGGVDMMKIAVPLFIAMIGLGILYIFVTG